MVKVVNDKKCAFMDLTESSQKNLIVMNVLFQNKEIKLKQLLGIQNLSQLTDELRDR